MGAQPAACIRVQIRVVQGRQALYGNNYYYVQKKIESVMFIYLMIITINTYTCDPQQQN